MIETELRIVFGERLAAIEETTEPGSAIEQARRLAAEGAELVIAIGGDGTVTDVMQGLIGTKAALAIIPLGTGNDYARTIGVGPDPQMALEALRQSRRIRTDIGKWTQGDRTGYFLNVAGCGFDAVVADRINHGLRRLRGQAAYLAAIGQTLFSYKPSLLTMIVDGETIEQRAMLCAMANARTYGGGMKIAPPARIDDGLLDLVWVGDFRPLEFMLAFPKLLKGTHLAHPKVSHRTFRRIEISSDPPVPMLVDGELLPALPLVIEVVPSAVEVVVSESFLQ